MSPSHIVFLISGCIIIFWTYFSSPASGKFPHLVASISRQTKNTPSTEFTTKDELDLNFGEVPVQTTAVKWIELHNFSPVRVILLDQFLKYKGYYYWFFILELFNLIYRLMHHTKCYNRLLPSIWTWCSHVHIIMVLSQQKVPSNLR